MAAGDTAHAAAERLAESPGLVATSVTFRGNALFRVSQAASAEMSASAALRAEFLQGKDLMTAVRRILR
jgi:hypothetical protein